MTSGVAGLYNIVADQGAAFTRTFKWRDPANKPIQLTGYTGRMQVRPSIESEDVVLELTTENGRMELGETTGDVVVYVDTTTMTNIESDRYVYDLELVAPNGIDVHKLVHGNFVVRAEVTR